MPPTHDRIHATQLKLLSAAPILEGRIEQLIIERLAGQLVRAVDQVLRVHFVETSPLPSQASTLILLAEMQRERLMV